MRPISPEVANVVGAVQTLLHRIDVGRYELEDSCCVEPGGVLVPKEILKREHLGSSDKLVYGVLRVLCGNEWTLVTSQNLADYVGIGLRTLHRSIAALADDGLIERRPVYRVAGHPNEYKVCNPGNSRCVR